MSCIELRTGQTELERNYRGRRRGLRSVQCCREGGQFRVDLVNWVEFVYVALQPPSLGLQPCASIVGRTELFL